MKLNEFLTELMPRIKDYVNRVIDERMKAIASPPVGFSIDRDGALIVMYGNGETKSLGVIVGKDGKAGKDGKDGKDGFSLEDFSVEYDGERTYTFKFADAAVKKEFAHSVNYVLDRGVWKAGSYVRGDGVTYSGSFWIAATDTIERPGVSHEWRLAAKRGRDAREPVRSTQ